MFGWHKAVNTLIPIPDKRPDAAAIVVEPHLTVRQNIQPGLLLVLQHGADRIFKRLGMVDILERLPDIPPVQLIGKPARAGIRADHGRGQERIGYAVQHGCLLLSILSRPFSDSASVRSHTPRPRI